ncbi:MAG TPA: hypothetical protein VF345_08730 [Chthoniobacterales bacterium]
MRTPLTAITVLLLCRLAVAGTVQQRLANDPAFKLYAAIFKITQAANGSITDVQLTPAVDVRWQQEHPTAPPKPVQVSIPKTYVAAAVKTIRAKRWPLFKHSGKPETFYTYFYYSPQLGNRVIEDVHGPE